MVRVESVIESWKTVRNDTAQALEDFPADELDFRPAPDMMTFRDLARHILDAGHGLTGLLLSGVDNFAVPQFREMLKPHMTALPEKPDAATLAASLRSEVGKRAGELSAQPPEFWSHMITRFDGMQVTRLEMLQFVKEHELTHRSQMFMYLRLKGIVPPTTRRRLAAKK